MGGVTSQRKRALKKERKSTVHVEGAIEVHPGFGIITINPKLFPLPVVYAASAKFLKKVYLLIDGDPSEEVIIEMRPRQPKADLVAVGRELSNQLVRELENYHKHSLPTLSPFVKALGDAGAAREEAEHKPEPPEQEKPVGQEISYEGDPLGIMKPWSESTAGKKR